MSKSANKMSVLQLTILTAVNMMGSGIIMKAGGHEGSELSKTKFVAFVASIYSLYACYASGFDAMTYGALVTFLGWTLYGFTSYRFDLKKAKADNEATGAAKGTA